MAINDSVEQQQLDRVSAQLAQIQRHLDAVTGHLSALEWLLKLLPCGIPVADGRVLTKTLYGSLLYVSAEDRLIAPHLLTNRVFEPEVSLLLEETLKPGDTFVDVGANIGYYTCAAGRKVGPTGKVFAFEADPATFTMLRDNVVLNYLHASTDCRNVAVSSERGTLKLFRRKRFHGNTSIIRLDQSTLEFFGDTDEEFDVECDTLDSLLKDYDQPIALVKIDVEGSESAVIEGMREVVKRNRDVRIVLEWALWTIRGAGGSPEQMWQLIEEMDMKVCRIENRLEEVSRAQLIETELCYLLLQRRQ